VACTVIRVLIVDDHRGIRLGLRAMVDAEPDLEVCGALSAAEVALEQAPSLCPDVVIMDLSMPGMGGIAATRAIREVCPDVHVLVLTWHADSGHVRDALAAGATGYVLKGDEHLDLIESVRAVARGERRLSQKVAGH
jgi:DNA-binding NarL/FixJ family response regulator